MLTLGQAARATGKAKVTLARAIKSGRMSAVRSPDGSYAIDPSELARCYPLTGELPGDMERSEPRNAPVSEPGASPGEVAALHARIAEQAETIRDLRTRLDSEAEERRRLLMLLTDQRAKTAPGAELPPAPARRSWWPWQRG